MSRVGSAASHRSPSRRLAPWAPVLAAVLVCAAVLLPPFLWRPQTLAIGLAAPIVVAMYQMYWRPLGGIALFVFAAGMFLLFGVRLFVASSGEGLLATAALSMDEFSSAQVLGNILLSLFGVSVAIGMLGLRSRTGVPAPRPLRDVSGPMPARELAVYLGVAVVGVATGLLAAATSGPTEMLEPGASKPGQLLWLLATPVPAILMLRGRRLLALTVCLVVSVVPVVGGRRQELLTPLLFLVFSWLATRTPAGLRLKARTVVRVAGLAFLLVLAVAVVSAAGRADTVKALYPREEVGVANVLVKDQVSTDLLYLAIAREPRPAPIEIFGRIVAIPVPRALWPGKPLSYDFAFRERHFPAFGGAMPVTIVGTAYLGLLFPGVVFAGFLVGRLARRGAVAIERRTVQSVLIGAAMLLLALDIVRVGGLYREFITFGISVVAIKVLTRFQST